MRLTPVAISRLLDVDKMDLNEVRSENIGWNNFSACTAKDFVANYICVFKFNLIGNTYSNPCTVHPVFISRSYCKQ